MKQSKYNFFIETNAENGDSMIVGFNAMTCALAKFTGDNYKKFLEAEANGYTNLDDEFRQKLLQGNFIVDDACDETLILRNNLLRSRYGGNTYGITIAPTLGCNFDCIYCYEQNHLDYTKMSEETQNKVIGLIQAKIDSGIKGLSVTWYGGEPLLAIDVIEELSSRIISMCDDAQISYHADLITNGYLLNREVAKKLQEFRVKTIQVTVDGPKDIHDTRRFLQGKKPTFERIIKNLTENVDVLPDIALRVNVDKDNIGRVEEVKALFSDEKLREKIHVYIAMVDAINGTYDKGECLSIEQFAALDLNFYDNPMGLYPFPHTNACGADSTRSIVIAPDGALYKCWNDIGIKEYSIGNINEAEPQYSERYYDYMMYDATADERCRDCKILPICMGGCPHRRMDNSPARCSLFKVYIENYLNKATRYLIARSAAESD